MSTVVALEQAAEGFDSLGRPSFVGEAPAAHLELIALDSHVEERRVAAGKTTIAVSHRRACGRHRHSHYEHHHHHPACHDAPLVSASRRKSPRVITATRGFDHRFMPKMSASSGWRIVARGEPIYGKGHATVASLGVGDSRDSGAVQVTQEV